MPTTPSMRSVSGGGDASHHSVPRSGRRHYEDSSDYYDYSTARTTARDRSSAASSGGALLHHYRIPRCLPKWLEFRKIMGRKPSPRESMACIFICCELVLGLALLAQMVVLWQSITQMSIKTATSEVKLLDLTYSIKVNQMGFGMRGQSQNTALITYLETGIGPSKVKTILLSEITARKMEFAMLLSTDALQPTILVNAQGNNRSGEAWDPDNLVSKLISDPTAGQIRTSKLVSYQTIMKENPTVYRERVSDLQDTDANHWTDIKSPTNLIRYIVTPVFTLTTPKTFLGVLLAGDVVEGKTPIAFSALEALGDGYTGVYTEVDGFFRRACSAYYQDHVLGHKVLTTHTNPVPQDLLQRAYSTTPSKTPPIITHVSRDLVYAAKQLPLGLQNLIPQTSEVTPGVAVRGVARDQMGIYQGILDTNLILIGIIMAFNFFSLIIALSFFILPLEKLAGRLRAKEKVDLKEVGQLKFGRKFAVGASLTLITSITCIALMSVTISKALNTARTAGAISNVGVAGVAYGIKRDQMSFGFRGQSTNAAIRSLLDSPGKSTLRSQSLINLRGEINNRYIEYATLVDKHGKIVLNAGQNDRWNESWDATGLVNLTLSTNLRYKKTAILPYTEFIAEGPPKWQERVAAKAPNSTLSPYLTHGFALIRYTSTPVYAASNSGTSKPDGVLISGDILNGKTASVERMLQVLDEGYAAFYFDTGVGEYALATGALKKSPTSALQVDYFVPTDEIKPLLDQVRAHPDKTFTRDVVLDGVPLVLAARRVPLDRFVGAFGDADIEDGSLPLGFMVYGKPRATTKELERNMTICTVICAIIQLLTTIFMNYKAYQPLNKLLKVMAKQGFIKPSATDSCWQRLWAFLGKKQPTVYVEMGT